MHQEGVDSSESYQLLKLWAVLPALQSCAEDASCTLPATEQALKKRLKGHMGLSVHVTESRSHIYPHLESKIYHHFLEGMQN